MSDKVLKKLSDDVVALEKVELGDFVLYKREGTDVGVHDEAQQAVGDASQLLSVETDASEALDRLSTGTDLMQLFGDS